MKRLVLLLAIISSLSVKAQLGSVKGKLKDTLSAQPVMGATITLMSAKDSSLVSFTMTDSKGDFHLTGIQKGNYRLLITHVNYHNGQRKFSLDENKQSIDLGEIPLGDKFKTLEEIVIEAEAPPVTLKADTVEYNAGSFKVQPNANVEDMLKKLPGVKVEKDGTVKAQGQKVNRVYVDGKEFFGNDPKIATRNLPADAVDKVQVYDRMSDQSQLTGFDDGNSEKAINLKLKKDKKKGLFGKINGGAGTDGRYEGRFNVNSFKNQRQLSAIGMANNTNAEGFSIMDILNFSSGNSGIQKSGGNISINITADDPNAGLLGMNNNNGINTTKAGGINYNDLIGKKTDFRSNYFFNSFNPYVERATQRQYILPDSSYFYNQKAISDNINNGHRFNLSVEHRIDSSASLKISPSFSLQSSSFDSRSTYQTLTDKQVLANEGINYGFGQSNGYNFRNDLLFTKKFRRKGRTFSFNLINQLNDMQGDGQQKSINSFFDHAGSLLYKDSINQENITASDLDGYTARAVYTEPLGKRMLVELSGSKSNTNSNSSRTTYDYNSNSGKFDEFNELLSNVFSNTYGYTNAGAKLRYQKQKFSVSAGGQWQEAVLKGKVNAGGKDTLLSQKFYNILPNARIQYNFTRFRNLNLNYFSNTNQPAISQLQPVPDISNPLSIKIGNPALKQEFIQMVTMNYMSVTPYKGTNFFAFLTYRQVGNRIVNSDSISTLGVKYTIPVNVNGTFQLNGDMNWGFPITSIKRTTLNLGLNGGLSKDIQFINRNRNNINTYQLRPEIRIENNALDKLNLGINYSSSMYHTRYSLQPTLNTKYFTHEIGSYLNWQMPRNFYFATDFTYLVNTQRAEGFNANVPLWNASLSRQFLKYNRAEMKVRVFDLLNQNVGINRTSNNNYIEDTRTNILRRYVMLSFTYSLSKSGLESNKGAGGIRIIR
ncbi:MAG TPA: outer membrane beta-barrel protein [Chitinophagaceae bacterium]|nr:outer membrane beta-barrel protein [Chitinophagaceae bacterium]